MTMPVITVTPHVAIDQTILLDRLVPGTVHRAESVRYNAGGKGVNVSSCLADWGVRSRASGFLGRGNAGLFETLCRDKGIDDLFIRVPGLCRTNVKLVDSRDTTDINLPGITVTPEDLAGLEAALRDAAGQEPGVAVLAGSLPKGCPDGLYARITELFGDAGFKVVLDADGTVLNRSLDNAALPFSVKPNRHELAGWAGKKLDGLESIADEAERLHTRGIPLVVVSLGSEGALFVADEGVLHAVAKTEIAAGTVGAGDAMVAGITAALCEGATLERIARLSTAFSIGKLSRSGPNLPPPGEVEAIAARVSITAIRPRTNNSRFPENRRTI